MNPVVEEWIQKAKADYRTAQRELTVVENPNYDAVCFHAQQSAEKIMKALLILRGVLPPKVHDLTYLSRLITEGDPDWSWPEEALHFLTRAAVDYRYPGESADYEEAAQAVDICARLLAAIEMLILRP
ncbi:MAG: HEPN domain-containing protein [Candidatus Latescibacter sp.]|nr:HEPN domain-containing protein [Candidatus Latescibacter sp.]